MERRYLRGLTLIELVVVVAMLALMLMVAVPGVSTWIRNTQIRNVASSIQNGLQKARAEAMRRNANVRFSLVALSNSAVMDNSCQLSEAGVSWVVSLDDPSGSCSAAVDDSVAPRILDKHASGGGGKWVTVVASDAGGADANVVTFNGFGRATNATGISTIDIDNDTPGDDFRALRIVVGTGGTIRMCEPKVTSSSDPRAC